MLRRYLARRKMRWAVREVARRHSLVLLNLIAVARAQRQLEGRWGDTAWQVLIQPGCDELLGGLWSSEQLDLAKLARGEDVGHD